MGIVEGEPDHTGLSGWAQMLWWLRRRWQQPRRKRDPKRVRMALLLIHQTEKTLQGTEH